MVVESLGRLGLYGMESVGRCSWWMRILEAHYAATDFSLGIRGLKSVKNTDLDVPANGNNIARDKCEKAPLLQRGEPFFAASDLQLKSFYW